MENMKFGLAENYVSNSIMDMRYVVAADVATALKCDGDSVFIGVVCGGNLKFTIDGVKYKVQPNEMFILYGGVAEDVKCSKAFNGYFLSVKVNYLTTLNVDTADFIMTEMVARTTVIFPLDSSYAEVMQDLAARIISLSQNPEIVLHDKVGESLSEAYVYMVISVLGAKPMNVDNVRSNSSLMVIKRFAELLKVNYMHQRSVDFYASQLGITSKYLSIVCRKHRGITASHIIDGAVIRQAKMLLKQQGVSVQDVAMQLNFPSQSFFGKYFKQRVGISPSRYKGDE